jgi:hypothetical protein
VVRQARKQGKLRELLAGDSPEWGLWRVKSI